MQSPGPETRKYFLVCHGYFLLKVMYFYNGQSIVQVCILIFKESKDVYGQTGCFVAWVPIRKGKGNVQFTSVGWDVCWPRRVNLQWEDHAIVHDISESAGHVVSSRDSFYVTHIYRFLVPATRFVITHSEQKKMKRLAHPDLSSSAIRPPMLI